jgi:hypothetical protein
MSADLVLTPGGYRPADQVHRLEPGHVIDQSGGRSRHLTQEGAVVADFGPLTRSISDQPLMPGGVRLPAAEEPAPFGQGWITYAAWTNSTGKPVSVLSTTWTVPPEPTTENGQTIYLFNGIQNSSFILQPVLQWGPSPAGGGEYWSIAAWWVSATETHYSALSRVEVGDVLLGGINVLDSSFRYVCGFRGPQGADMVVQNVQELTFCVQTLEAYKITAATDYPNTAETAMGQIALSTGWAALPEPTLSWTAVTPITDAGQRTVVVSNSPTAGEVDLYY